MITIQQFQELSTVCSVINPPYEFEKIDDNNFVMKNSPIKYHFWLNGGEIVLTRSFCGVERCYATTDFKELVEYITGEFGIGYNFS